MHFCDKILKNFQKEKIEQNRDKTSIKEKNGVNYLNYSLDNRIFTNFTKKLLTFEGFCTIFLIIIISRLCPLDGKGREGLHN